MLNRKRIAAAVLAGIVSATSMTAIGCGRHAADANQSSEDIESSEETEEETETIVEEEIDLEKVKIDEEDLTETDPDESYEADEDSAVEREDGSVVVEATNEQGQKVVLVYENKEAFEKKENASIVSDAAVKEATTEVVVTVPKETTAGTKGNGSGSSTGTTTASGNKPGSTSAGTSSGNKETSGSGSASGSTKPSNSGNSGSGSGSTGSGSASKPTNGATQPSTSAPTAAPTQPATSAPTQAPTQAPTAAPTEAPTPAPTEAPTKSEFELMTEYFNATSEATIKQYFLAGFNAQRAAAGLGPVPEDATLTAQAQDIANRNAAAHYAGHAMDYGMSDYFLNAQYESSFPIAALEFPSNQPDPMSNGRFEGYAYHCGSEAGILHNPHFYTANTECIGIGIARDTSQNTFYLVIEGRDYGFAD